MNAADTLARLAAFGLPGASTEPVTVDGLGELIGLAEQRRALSWVRQAVEVGAVRNMTTDFEQVLRTRHLGAVQTTLAAHAATVRLVERLAAAGITDVRILKGCATGHLDYPRPADRFSTDVDVLIPACDLEQLASAFPPGAIPEPRRRQWQERYGKSTTVIDEHRVEIDLHVAISEGYFGLAMNVDDLRRDPVRFTIGPIEALALDGPNRLLHAAVHVGSSPQANYNSARDVLQLALVSDVGWFEAKERAERWRVDALFALGVRRAWETFAVEPHPLLDWARSHRTAGRQRLAIRMVGDRPRGLLLTAPLALPVRNWPGYVIPILAPSPAYLAENQKTRSSRLKSIVAELKFW